MRGRPGRDSTFIANDNATIVCHCDTPISKCYGRNKILIYLQAADTKHLLSLRITKDIYDTFIKNLQRQKEINNTCILNCSCRSILQFGMALHNNSKWRKNTAYWVLVCIGTAAAQAHARAVVLDSTCDNVFRNSEPVNY